MHMCMVLVSILLEMFLTLPSWPLSLLSPFSMCFLSPHSISGPTFRAGDAMIDEPHKHPIVRWLTYLVGETDAIQVSK